MSLEKPTYEIVLEAMEAGGATNESLMAIIGGKTKRSVTNQIAFINVLKKYPVEGEDGVYVVLDEEAYEDHLKSNGAGQKTPAAPKKIQNPQGKMDTLKARLVGRIGKLNKAKASLDNNPESTKCKLRHTIALCEFHLCSIEMEELKNAIAIEFNLPIAALDDIEDLNDYQETVGIDLIDDDAA